MAALRRGEEEIRFTITSEDLANDAITHAAPPRTRAATFWRVVSGVNDDPAAISLQPAQLYVATSMQQGAPPSVALNGVAFNGALPAGTDDPFTRQAVRSAWGQATVLTIDAGVIVKGLNNVTFTSIGAGGTGWDLVCLEVENQ